MSPRLKDRPVNSRGPRAGLVSDGQTEWIERPQIKRTGPDRSVGNYYRGAADDGKAIGGIPLTSAEAAVVAVVRMAYRVAETQIDRSARLARRLREEGDRAGGPGSPQKALDATERVVFRAAMTLVEWLEGFAADRGNPLQRLAAAQYRLMGALLGLVPPETPEPRDARAPDRAFRRADTAGPEHGLPRREDVPSFPVRIRHAGPERRAVRICAWDYTGETGPRQKILVKFYHVRDGSRPPLKGELLIAGRRSVTLTLTTPPSAPAGRWRAAFCDADGVQVGAMEIML
jgi:hypothetical protein